MTVGNKIKIKKKENVRGVDGKRSRGGGALLVGAEESSFRGFDIVNTPLFIQTVIPPPMRKK